MISREKVWFDNKVGTFIKESKECGGMSIIEIDGIKTHATTKALFTFDKISTMFSINQEPTLDSDVEEALSNCDEFYNKIKLLENLEMLKPNIKQKWRHKSIVIDYDDYELILDTLKQISKEEVKNET